jgi:hypothetical protein
VTVAAVLTLLVLLVLARKGLRFRGNPGGGVAATPPPVMPNRDRRTPSAFRLRGPQGGM